MKKPDSKTSIHACKAARPAKKGFFLENRWTAWSLVVLSLVSIGFSFTVHHKIYAEVAKKTGLDLFQEISESRLTDDATFSGVEFFEGRLYSTYDRTKARTKKACPT
ncbi:MAG: hypothetical protein KJ645_01670 [Planctomycetes bacterium]|nr:hypothetical protein [Planctomycetota bacterium]